MTGQLKLFNDLILPPRSDLNEARNLMNELRNRGIIIGTDEAGRGALAGPVVAAAVYLTQEQEDELISHKLRDSKRITAKGREKIFAFMNDIGVKWRAYSGSVAKIDHDNVLQASLWTMGMCVMRLSHLLSESPACVIVDGTERISRLPFPQWTLIRADDLIPVVSAASIVAKVLRDRLMRKLDKKFSGYDLAQNKGYPTRAHMEAVRSLGISEIHRKTFCRKILAKG